MLDFFFQAEDGIRDLVRSRGLGDVYKRQGMERNLDRHCGGSDRSPSRSNCLFSALWNLESGNPLSLIHISEPTRPY